MERPALRFAYFAKKMPSAGRTPPRVRLDSTVVEPNSPGRVGPDPIFFLIGFVGVFGNHTVTCRVLGPAGEVPHSDLASTKKKVDPGHEWTAVFPLSFPPGEIGSYIVEIALDGESVCRRIIDVLSVRERLEA